MPRLRFSLGELIDSLELFSRGTKKDFRRLEVNAGGGGLTL